MKRFLAISGFLACLAQLPGLTAFAAGTNAPAEYRPPAGTNGTGTVLLDWLDAKRDRKLPVKIYFPESGRGPFPVIVFSHGLGGSREGYEYLGRHWAGCGYVSVHLQHPGSDSALWMGSSPGNAMPSLRRAAAKPENALNRPLDVSFAIDELEKLNATDPRLKGRLDLTRLGVAGHSFGAFTTLAVAGQVFVTPAGREITFLDSRVKAAVAMSAPVVMNKALLDRAYGKINIPCLHLTGTEDSSPIGDTRPADRRLPFDHMTGSDQFLLTLEGGDHMIFSGASSRLKPGQAAAFKALICDATTAFWDAYLKNEAAARTWLANGGFRRELGTGGTFEAKLTRAK